MGLGRCKEDNKAVWDKLTGKVDFPLKEAELLAIQREQTNKRKDEEDLRRLEVETVVNHKKTNFGNARVVCNKPTSSSNHDSIYLISS